MPESERYEVVPSHSTEVNLDQISGHVFSVSANGMCPSEFAVRDTESSHQLESCDEALIVNFTKYVQDHAISDKFGLELPPTDIDPSCSLYEHSEGRCSILIPRPAGSEEQEMKYVATSWKNGPNGLTTGETKCMPTLYGHEKMVNTRWNR